MMISSFVRSEQANLKLSWLSDMGIISWTARVIILFINNKSNETFNLTSKNFDDYCPTLWLKAIQSHLWIDRAQHADK